ncbi:MAG TPA: Asp-tRNA(Asn)/Glu-tRNA(Gln) amidotransferase subunit GatC [Phycisphaerae bacterium]|jgi:aspartyl-tRNA(Asn)/glutamyl-tRNA(Gln) amidotransferase subunit C|nr:Asp-tRNA(Asn)/Glu-tRNA(Gln) amidotransferase subunit GatC [Phycisphaerae bacterium]HPC23755.1 Asp-tRNA(Asn)/Glu-tRNA(Gln) amidotransferase subunit GatC [Phycisphaerae bacterium]HRS28711.1 Asp-tRNA(Asn)/Glu-tRNA(Gln) amidotransferase subunit GatC [Phycisphaerae bacterium]
MPAQINEEHVRRIARLSRLKLTEDEVALFAGQLGRIVDYVEQLREVDTTGVEPMAHPLPVTNVAREDEPHVPFDNERALANAPQRADGFFKVPPVLDHSGGA